MNKKYKHTLLLLALMAQSNAWASKALPKMSPEMQGPPSVEAPSCNLSAGPETVDFGSRSRAQLSPQSGGLTPGSRLVTVMVGCTVPQTISLQFNGAVRNDQFSYGTDSVVRVRAIRAQLDGQPVTLQRESLTTRLDGESATGLEVYPGDIIHVMKQGQQGIGKQLGFTLEITPVMGERDTSPARQTQTETGINVRLVGQ